VCIPCVPRMWGQCDSFRYPLVETDSEEAGMGAAMA
jgi:hypothetical protein